MLGHSHFDNAVLYLILFSTILLEIEDPFEYTLSKKKQVMDLIDVILSFLFLFEFIDQNGSIWVCIQWARFLYKE